ncbi:hypothetical protein [Paenibacillus elgii]|uniref:hypothetical protein n=1 Tax=Paenibacillus elgii TaxID=189691 RepID=UPI000248D6B4|nr:hypothetical protein [Paenibacillus elgii]
MTMEPYKIRIIGRACITRFTNAEAADLKTIIDVNYNALATADRTSVVAFVADTRPDIPYENTKQREEV